jgi:predicted flap endonuclease-1-like 5' DNA nuclease
MNGQVFLSFCHRKGYGMYKQMADFWIDLMFWWVPRERQVMEASPPKAAPTPSVPSEPVPSTPSPAVEAAPEKPARVAADLTVIKGIGPALQKKLAELNIINFGDLAEADPEMLTNKLKGSQPISPAKVRSWTESARTLAQA